MKRLNLIIILLFAALILQAQNIGIGTPNPDYTLDVNGSLGINDFIYHNDDDNADTWIGFPGNDAFEVVVGGKRMVLADGVNNQVILNADTSDTRFIIVADGIEHLMDANPVSKTIGIGTSTPQYLLDVKGDFRVVGDAVDHLFYIDATANRVGIGTPTPTYLVDVSGDFRVIGDQIEHLFFVDASSGKVGINTSTPVADLDVNGTIRAYELNASDVFIVDAVNQRVGINDVSPSSTFDVAGEIAGEQLKLGDNQLPFLETVQTGIVDSLFNYAGNNAEQVIITFPNAFSNPPYVIGTVTNKNTVSEDIYISSLRTVSNTQAIFNVGLYGTGNPLDTIRLTWMAWE